jgi:hypothetical protein
VHALIAADVKADTRKLDSTEALLNGLTTDMQPAGGGPMRHEGRSLKTFATERRA